MVEFNSNSQFNMTALNRIHKNEYQYEHFVNDDYRALENCISEQ